MRLTSNSNTIKSPRRKGAGRARNQRARPRMFRPAAKSAAAPVRLARTIDDPPPRSRVPTHNLGGIVRIDARRTQCWLAFRRSPLSLPRRASPRSPRFSTSSTMTMPLSVILLPRYRGYVLSIIEAASDVNQGFVKRI